MPVVTSLPSSNSNRGHSYARAEYRNARGERRVLVVGVTQSSRGRRGGVALRDGLGARDLPGTREPMSRDELVAWLVRLDAGGRATVGGDEIVFPEGLLGPFLDRCRARLEDARRGVLSKTDPLE